MRNITISLTPKTEGILPGTVSLLPKKTCQNSCNHSYFMFVHFRGRLGNSMFEFASSLAIASRCKLVPVYDTMNDIFKIFSIQGVMSEAQTCKDCKEKALKHQFSHPKNYIHAYLYDAKTEELGNFACRENSSIYLKGYWHSWHYFYDIQHEIKKNFEFRNNIKSHARMYLKANIPVKWVNVTFIRVGVHIRLSDRKDEWNTIYLRKAASYYTEQFKNIQFVVCSDQIHEAKRIFPKGNYEVLYSKNSRETDLAILASCHHSIITVGTFGWWGAWFAGGQVVYYNGFPPLKPKSVKVTREQVQKDYYLPHWHPL